MNKRDYIQHRLHNHHDQIAFAYAREHGFGGSFREFGTCLQFYDLETVTAAKQMAILYYDLKFKLTYVIKVENDVNIVLQILG